MKHDYPDLRCTACGYKGMDFHPVREHIDPYAVWEIGVLYCYECIASERHVRVKAPGRLKEWWGWLKKRRVKDAQEA